MSLQIIVPFYGDPSLLRLAVGSVLDQTHPDWTLTVVDDGYPDSAVPAYFASIDDPRVRYLRNEVNLGANGNYRRCLELADQELVVLLGADDELMPNYVATMLRARAAAPAAAVLHPGVQVIDENGETVQPLADTVKQRILRPRTRSGPDATGGGRRLLGGEQLATTLLRGNWMYFPALVFARVPAQQVGFRPGLDVVQDLALVLDLVVAGHPMALEDTLCFRYRRHTASDSSWRALAGSRFVEEREFFRDEADRMTALGWNRAARAARWYLLSRMNALALLPKAARAGHWAGLRSLVRHVAGRPKRRRR